MERKKILHFRIWSNPPISKSVENLLRETFPEFDLEVITLWDSIKADQTTMRKNMLAVARQYGWDILTGRLDFKAAFFRTVFLFDHMRGMAEQIGKGRKDIAFTFQLQSIFDTHLEGIPHFVYTDHTHLANLLYSPLMKVNLYSAEWISREKTIYMHADRVFTRSSDISRSLCGQYGIPAEKVRCIYAGANTPMEIIDPKKKDYSAGNILFVGLDWVRKGGPDLLKAFERVYLNHPEASLTIVGPQFKLEQAGVVSRGKVSVEELNRYYRQASIFCMPSRNEPFGVAFVEAMSHALPIVAAGIGALPDMVVDGNNGFLIQPGDIDGLAKALDTLLGDADMRARFGRASWKMARERYNWPAVGRLLRRSIDECLQGKKHEAMVH